MNWVLIVWIYTGSFGFPEYFGSYKSYSECEKVFNALEIRMPGNGNTINNHMCMDVNNPTDGIKQ